MTTLQAFLLGIMVAWTPALLFVGWTLYRDLEPAKRDRDRIEHPALGGWGPPATVVLIVGFIALIGIGS